MASPFQKYQGEQVQQIAPGFIEAYGRAGQSIGAGIAGFAEQVVKGYQVGQEKEKQEALLKGQLEPYIKNDERTKRVNDLVSGGVLVKNSDGTVGISAQYADKVDINEANKLLDFYNTTGGDGSKLTGEALTNFAARYQGEQKYAAEQAAAAKSKLENDLTRAKINDLNAKAAERNANAGLYAEVISGMGFNVAMPPAADITKPVADISTPFAAAPAAPSFGPEPSVAANYANAPTEAPAEPAKISPALTAGTEPAEKAAAPAAPAATPAPTPKAAAAPAPTPTPSPAQAPKTAPAPKAAPAAPVPAPAPAPAPAAVKPIDIKAEAARVAEENKKLDQEEAKIRTKYAKDRSDAEVKYARVKSTKRIPANKIGFDLTEGIEDYWQSKQKAINDAEARDLEVIKGKRKALDDAFSRAQTMASEGRAEKADVRAEKAATRAEEAATLSKNKFEAEKAAREEDRAAKAKAARKQAVGDYPRMGVWTHAGYNLKDKQGNKVDPFDYGIPALEGQAKNDAISAYEGYTTGIGFLMDLDRTLKDRIAGDEGYKERFRLTTSDMEEFYKGEFSSVFGVATFRRAIVSGGNFSDADREFVKSVITYINTAAPDLSDEDLKSSLNALATFISSMYARKLESYGMRFNPQATKEYAAQMRSLGNNAEADFALSELKDVENFNSEFGIRVRGASTRNNPEFTRVVDDARATLWRTLEKGGVDTSAFKGSKPGVSRPANGGLSPR